MLEDQRHELRQLPLLMSDRITNRSSADDGHTDTLNSGCEQGFWAGRGNEPVCLQIGRGRRLGDSSRVRGVLWLLGGVGEWGEVVEPRGLGEVERAQDLALAVGQLGAL